MQKEQQTQKQKRLQPPQGVGSSETKNNVTHINVTLHNIQKADFPELVNTTATTAPRNITMNYAVNYAYRFYNLSMYLAVANSSMTTSSHVDLFRLLHKVHLIRVPKASSSSLSAVARRAVGCSPPGPCCHFPGEPAGSCPSREMFRCQEAKKVIGCTDHFPFLWYLFEPSVPSISIMRNPFTRSLSGFFYPGIHHNSDCSADQDTCFRQYMASTKWKNVVVKMLTGDYAYSPRNTCATNTTCHNSLQLAAENLNKLTFMGIAEMWELSLLVLHRKIPTLAPMLSEFAMGQEQNTVAKGKLCLNLPF